MIDPMSASLEELHVYLELETPKGPELVVLRDQYSSRDDAIASAGVDMCNEKLLLSSPQLCLLCGLLAESNMVTCSRHDDRIRQEWEEWVQS